MFLAKKWPKNKPSKKDVQDIKKNIEYNSKISRSTHLPETIGHINTAPFCKKQTRLKFA